MIPSPAISTSLACAALFAIVASSAWSAPAAALTPDDLGDVAELVASDAQPGDFVGWSVAVDGDTIVVGAWAGAGAAYVFTRSGSGWVEQAKLVPLGATYAYGFGTGVAIDGDTIVVGAPGEDLAGGAIYVFERASGAWDAGRRISLAGISGLGSAVAIEGDRIAAGASANDGNVVVFERSGTDWTVRQVLSPSGSPGVDRMGSSVALHGDRIVAGAPTAVAGGIEIGQAYVFDFDGAIWTQSAILSPSTPVEFAGFRSAVSLDGDLLAVGAPALSTPPVGTVYVYSRVTGAWLEEERIPAVTGDPEDRFGSAVALRGNRLVVGAHIAGGGTGEARVFTRSLAAWTETWRLVPANLDFGSRFGLSVAISGADVVVGAPYGSPAGSTFVFEVAPTATWNYCLSEPNRTGLPAILGSSGSTSVAANDFVLLAGQCPPGVPGMFLCGEARAEIPMAKGHLCVSPYHPGLFRLGPTAHADASGVASHAIDLGDLPAGLQIPPGSTRYFQLWYRDVGPAGYNLSDGLGATFVP